LITDQFSLHLYKEADCVDETKWGGLRKSKEKAMNTQLLRKRYQKKYNVPVIGHFGDKSVRFSTIIDAERITGINYNLIFEACVGKIYRAGNVIWEFEKGNHYIKYKAYYLRAMEKIKELEHGHGD
jgi:hypothetical protein